MIFLNLEIHDIDFCYPSDVDITNSEIGKWLSDNKIDYKVVTHNLVHRNLVFDVMRIIELLFYNEEDVVAFKLRWSN